LDCHLGDYPHPRNEPPETGPFSFIVVALCAMQNSSHLITAASFVATGCSVCSQVIDVLEAQINKETGNEEG